MSVRSFHAGDLDWMLALNTVHEVELSPLTRASLVALLDTAVHARVVDDRAAMLIAFDQDSDYDSANFLWFRARYERFAYVDRIVVDDTHRGRGLARTLYEDFFECMRKRGHTLVACEVNSDPPNPGSDAFHEALGFVIVGEAALPDRGKHVRYMTKTL